MTEDSAILVWFRRDLRLADHAALDAACATGRPVIPVFVLDETTAALGAAAKWRLGLGVETLARALKERGSRLILRRGAALDEIRALVAQTGAGAVWWSRLYDPKTTARDTDLKTALKGQGVDARSFAGHLLFEPWAVTTGAGGFYRVFTPFWNAVRGRAVAPLLPAPVRMQAPPDWPQSQDIAAWNMAAGMNRGAAVVRPYLRLGEAAALDRLDAFAAGAIARYREDRDNPGRDGTSGLSENLALGEISPARCWHVGQRAAQEGKAGAATFLKELVWREFACHLMFHTPHILDRNWRAGWENFPWSRDATRPGVRAWLTARTGIPFVDAGLREMYVTGRMHNRARMVVASYLTKHLLADWRIGLRWFADCLTDWDVASNAMGWQWVAGCGPDAAPYFRIFNPVTQLAKFDPTGAYARTWIAEGQRNPPATALAYFDAVPRHWKLDPGAPYPAPVVDVASGRAAALAAYQTRETQAN